VAARRFERPQQPKAMISGAPVNGRASDARGDFR
jgi:hypothetical protein